MLTGIEDSREEVAARILFPALSISAASIMAAEQQHNIPVG